MRAVLISTYELGRQPFGLASPAAWLARVGIEVTCCDLSREALGEDAVRAADMIAFYVPMHTATRLAIAALPRIRELNPRAFLCFYGLYAPVNEAHLRELGVQSVLGGEFEEELAQLVLRLEASRPDSGIAGQPLAGPRSSRESENGVASGAPAPKNTPIPRLQFITPQRTGLPALKEYGHVMMPGGGHRVAGYTEASRGCKHLCRHCPVVPVYHGAFRVVQPDAVLGDIRQQAAGGAEHITFGDPDFFNGPAHAMRVVEDLHREFPLLSYDVTIKIEHLRKHADLLPRLRDTGCLFVTSAVESVEDLILERLDKGHTRADFVRTVKLLGKVGLPLQPTFVPFTPWTTLEGYADLLGVLAGLELVENVSPIQLAIRLLIPSGSRLLELEEMRGLIQPFDATSLAFPWQHADPHVDALQREIEQIVQSGDVMKRGRARTFERIWDATQTALAGGTTGPTKHRAPSQMPVLASRATIPYLNEPWYC